MRETVRIQMVAEVTGVVWEFVVPPEEELAPSVL